MPEGWIFGIIFEMAESILHIAPQNIAGVPGEMVREERRRGFDSTLVTFSPHPYGFDSGECLDLPLASGRKAAFVQKLFGTSPETVNRRRRGDFRKPPAWEGGRFPARYLFALRDRIWEPRFRAAGFPERLREADIVVLDGGLPLLRSGKWIRDFAERGGRLAITYYGTDLRHHGVIWEIDDAAGAVFLMEFDHTLLHPRGTWLPFPFDARDYERANPPEGAVRIGHAAAKRNAKGTNRIIEAIREVGESRDVEAVIMERMPHEEVLELKSTCHIFVDQLGELGYGISGLESLAMGIPTVVELLPDHDGFLGDHPFVNANADNLARVLRELVDNPELRTETGEKGYRWVREFHSPRRCIDRAHGVYRELGWI